MAFVVHLNNWGEVTLNVENSSLESTYCAVRVFNSGFDNNNVTIRNTKMTGATRAFWVHNYIDDLDKTKHSEEAINSRFQELQFLLSDMDIIVSIILMNVETKW